MDYNADALASLKPAIVCYLCLDIGGFTAIQEWNAVALLEKSRCCVRRRARNTDHLWVIIHSVHSCSTVKQIQEWGLEDIRHLLPPVYQKLRFRCLGHIGWHAIFTRRRCLRDSGDSGRGHKTRTEFPKTLYLASLIFCCSVHFCKTQHLPG